MNIEICFFKSCIFDKRIDSELQRIYLNAADAANIYFNNSNGVQFILFRDILDNRDYICGDPGFVYANLLYYSCSTQENG